MVTERIVHDCFGGHYSVLLAGGCKSCHVEPVRFDLLHTETFPASQGASTRLMLLKASLSAIVRSKPHDDDSSLDWMSLNRRRDHHSVYMMCFAGSS